MNLKLTPLNVQANSSTKKQKKPLHINPQLPKWLDQLNDYIIKAEYYASIFDTETSISIIYDAIKLSERICNNIRSYPYLLSLNNEKAMTEVTSKLVDVLGYKVGYEQNGWFLAVIPRLLPKKNHHSQEGKFIKEALFITMDHYTKTSPFKKISNGVIIFCHVYNKDTPENMYRDNDNIEVKGVTDIICTYLLGDDISPICSHFHFTISGDNDETRVFLVPKKEFSEWVKQYFA